ncbi:hypothetical protein BDN72DRAFT_338246 [Pluteus cervinus]|uniref:Uncharacterized protein n=1 Tax=Pluteus cervinus TaxID=181527 RepID=A0ACD3ABH8_9AGAR|nr:hypothetical protein BDN72DRAFT_338246 [Pluteus cervinus]
MTVQLGYLLSQSIDFVARVRTTYIIIESPQNKDPLLVSLHSSPTMIGHFNRNIQVYDGRCRLEVAGCWQFGRTTIATFYQWLDVALIGSITLFHCANRKDLPLGEPLDRKSTELMATGTYVILDDERLPANIGYLFDKPLPRENSADDPQTPGYNSFVSRVRARDRRCCFTGEAVIGENFTGFEVAHIFPLGQLKKWKRRDMQRFITDPEVADDEKMNSVQQGFLVSSSVYELFKDYQLGVNPDDGYRITDFAGRDGEPTLDGKIFYVADDVPEYFRPSPDLLREHYRQCILACINGPFIFPAPEPEEYFVPGGVD